MGFDWDVLVDRDDYYDVNNQTYITESDYKRYARMLEKDPVDDNFKAFLSFLMKKPSNEPLKKRKGIEKDDNAPETDGDCYTDEKDTDDRENGLWFRKLIEDGNSYILEVERDGLPFLKYEGEDEGSDKESGFSDYKRKLRSTSKKKYGPSKESSFTSSEKEDEDLDQRKLKGGSKKDNGLLKESRFTFSEEEAEDSGQGKLRSGANKSRGPSNKSRCTSSEDLGLRNLGSGSRKYNGPLNESRFTLSEEEADDSVRRKLRSWSSKYNGPSNELKFTLNEEAEDSGRRKLRDRLKKDNGPSNESRFTSSEEEAEDSGQEKLRSGANKSRGPSNKSTCTSSQEESEDLGLKILRSGSRNYNEPLNESRFTLSEEEADDSVRRKLRSWSSKYNGPSNESKFTLNEETEDSGRRELRSGLKENNGPSNESRFTSSEEEAEDLGQRNLRSDGAKKKKMETGETSSVETEPHYRILLRGIECSKGWAVFEDGDVRVVLEESNSEESNHQRDDEWGPFVEILDKDTFYKVVNLSHYVEAATNGLENTNKGNRYSNPGVQFEYRRQLIAALRKPYDKEEYDKLWEDIRSRKREVRHLDLRHGRERSCSTDKYGKSYLDHYPDLKKELLLLGDNKPKRLNLLRGFFFWLQKNSQEGSFAPWRNAECLSIIPGSG